MILAILYNRPFLLLVSVAFASNYVYNYFQHKQKKKARKEINEVLLFSYKDGNLKKSKYSRCKITPSMDRLLYHLNSARYSIDICMYVMTNLDLTNVIIKLHYRGIKVRILTDADMAYTQGSNFRKFEKLGIPIRWMKSTNLMHHKFCLIDASTDNPEATPRVITGSLNWTNQALYGNWEDVVVTSQTNIVEQYKVGFENLWIVFKPIVGM